MYTSIVDVQFVYTAKLICFWNCDLESFTILIVHVVLNNMVLYRCSQEYIHVHLDCVSTLTSIVFLEHEFIVVQKNCYIQ